MIRHAILIAMLLLASATVRGDCISDGRAALSDFLPAPDDPTALVTISGPMTVDDIEAKELAACPACERPFGVRTKDWIELKGLVQPGDCIIAFGYSAGKGLVMGSSGYALIRGPVLVKQVITISE